MNKNIRLIRYALLFKKSLFIGLILLIFAMVAQLISPLLVRRILDIEMKRERIYYTNILFIVGIYLLLVGLESLFQYFSGIQLRITAMKVVTRMRMELYQKLQTLPISYFDNMASGNIVSKISNDTEAVQSLYVKVMGQIMMSMGYIMGTYIALFMINVSFAMVVFMLLPIIFGLITFYGYRARVYNDFIRIKIGEINGMIHEVIQGISIIQVFNKQKQVEKEFTDLIMQNYQKKRKLIFLNAISTYNGIGLLRDIIFIILIYFFGKVFLNTQSITTVGMLYVYLGYISLLLHHMTQIMEQITEMEKSGMAANHVFELLDMPEKKENSELYAIDKVDGEVVFENISFFYKEGEYVLHNVNIYANPGDTIALVGHTGSGKSSIMNLLMKFYIAQEGKIWIDGMDLSEIRDKEIRKYMGIVLQEPFLFTGSIFSNIGLNNPKISKEATMEALKLVGGESLLEGLKDGIDTIVVEKGATLSSGQRQLISFARALAHNPKILILDEATSSIDSETEQIIQKATQILMQGRTTFIIAHRLSTIKNANRIYLLEKGHIIEEGTHEDLIAKRGKYYEMYQIQSKT